MKLECIMSFSVNFFCSKLVSILIFFWLAPPVSNAQLFESKILPFYTEAEHLAGIAPGDGEQHMTSSARSKSDPNRIYLAQDVAGVWVSLDAGKTWNTLRNEGLNAQYMIAIEVDPLDKNRVLAAAQARYYDRDAQNAQGIYLSKNGGINWERKAVRKDLGEIRNSTKLIAYAPTSIDTTLGYTKRWYAAFSEYKKLVSGDSNTADDGLMYSNDGGESWTEIRKLPNGTYGSKINGIKVDPSNQDVIYIYGNAGLFRFDDATDSSGAWVKISRGGSEQLPLGEIYGDLYISPDSKTFIVAVEGEGIFKSIDEGNNWTELYNWNNVKKCFVNEAFPAQIYATATKASNQQIRYSNNGGSTWISNVNSVTRPGEDQSTWNTHIYREFAWVLPDPRDSEKAFAIGNAKFHRTDDGGAGWRRSDDYFNGSQHVSINAEQMFDPTDPDRFVYFAIDKGVWLTGNGGLWFYESNVKSGELGAHATCHGGALHPDASTGIILTSITNFSMGKLIRSEDDGKTWNVILEDTKPRWFIGFDQQNPNYCYQYREISSDAGKTWNTIPNFPQSSIIVGMSYQDGKVIYAYDKLGQKRHIYRSDNRGATWQTVVDISGENWNLACPSGDKYVFRVHPLNDSIIYTTGPNGQVRQWDLTKPVDQRVTDYDVFNGDAPVDGFFTHRFAIDRRHPEVMYVLNKQVYNGYKLFRTNDGGTSWQNMSESFPNTTTQGMEVSPHTGELFLAGANGSYVFLPPYKTSNTAFEKVNYPNTYINEPYTAEAGQIPYNGSTGAVPGKIECEEYDEGGQNISYNDDGEKKGDLTYRPDDNVDIVALPEASNGFMVSWGQEGEWLEYTVDVDAGIYDIVLTYSSDSTENGDLQLALGGIAIGRFNNLKYTGGKNVFLRDTIRKVSLLEGESKLLKMKYVNGGNFNIDNIEIKPATYDVVSISIEDCPVQSLIVGTTHKLTGVITPLNATNPGTIWQSSNSEIIEVDETGLLTVISEGSAQIMLTTLDGGFSDTCTLQSVAVTQSPYAGTNSQIPGTIECEYYDEGGQGVAYNDDGSNSGDADLRSNEMVDIVEKAEASNGYSIGYSNSGEWVEFTVDVTEGTYDLILSHASGNSTVELGDMQVSLDGIVIGTFSDINYTGGWRTFINDTIAGIALSGGNDRILRMEYINGATFDIDAITFEKSNVNSLVDNILPHEDFNIYPNPYLNGKLVAKYKGPTDNTFLRVLSMTGKEIIKMAIHDTYTHIPVAKLKTSGVYLAQLESGEKVLFRRKLVVYKD